MFKVDGNAEVRNLNVRRQASGDEWVRAIDVKIMALAVPVGDISGAVPDIEKHFYGKSGDVLLAEIFPLKVRHKIENVEAVIGPVTLKGADVAKIEVTPQPGKMANVLLSIQSSDFSDKDLAALTKVYTAVETKLAIVERQASIPDMEQ